MTTAKNLEFYLLCFIKIKREGICLVDLFSGEGEEDASADPC